MNEAKIDAMLADHKSGMTYKQIAEKHGVSTSRVGQLIGGSVLNAKNWFHTITPDACVYQGLRKWMNENSITCAELTRRIWGHMLTNNYARLHKCLKGEIYPRKPMIDKLIEITGLKYEELFSKEEIQE